MTFKIAKCTCNTKKFDIAGALYSNARHIPNANIEKLIAMKGIYIAYPIFYFNL